MNAIVNFAFVFAATGVFSEDVTDVYYDLEFNATDETGHSLYRLGQYHGWANTSKPLRVGGRLATVGFEPTTFKAGKVAVNGDMLFGTIPSSNGVDKLEYSRIHFTATAKNGDKLFCIKISTQPTLFRIPDGVALFWSDCGDASTKIEFEDFSPIRTIVEYNHNTKIVATGVFSEDVTDAYYDLEFNVTDSAGHSLQRLGQYHGWANTSKPLRVGGSLATVFLEPTKFPLKAGKVAVNGDLLFNAIPSGHGVYKLHCTRIHFTATAKNGDKLFCMKISTQPTPYGGLSLVWSDCGDASTKTKFEDFSPSRPGYPVVNFNQKTAIVATGFFRKDVAGVHTASTQII